MLVLAGLAGILTLTSEKARAGIWFIDQIDLADRVGQFASMKMDATGGMHVSYYDSRNGDLKYAHWDGSTWQIAVVDSEGGVGRHSSLALDSSGRPHISYLDDSNFVLKHAWWNGIAWLNETVDSSPDVGTQTSIAIGSNDLIHISYRDEANRALKHAWWDGVRWNMERVDGSDSGYGTSIVLNDSGFPRISYGRHPPPVDPACALRYASWNGVAWSVEVVDSAWTTGLFSSLAIDSAGNPHIAYYSETQTSLMYEVWNETAWNREVVDGSGDVGQYSSLFLDSTGTPHISYYNNTGGDLMYARWNGISWSTETVDSLYNTGMYTSIAVDAGGIPHIIYYDSTRTYLMHAYKFVNHPPNTPMMPFGPGAGSVGTRYIYQTMAIDPDRDQIKYTFDWNDSTTSETGYVDSGNIGGQGHTWLVAGVYQVRAMATDVYNATSPWSRIWNVTITGPPPPPTDLTASRGNGRVDLTWLAPTYDGGQPITNYTIYRGPGPTTEVFLVEIGNVTAYGDTGLANGQEYCYQATASNINGEGLRSNEACATPATIPGASLGLTAAAGNRAATLTWRPPADDGDSQIVKYHVYRGTAAGGETPLIALGVVLNYTDTGLTNGQLYYYRIGAENDIGNGTLSSEASVMPATLPGAPANIAAEASDGKVTLTWAPPVDDGGMPVTGYMIYRGNETKGEILLAMVGNSLTYEDVNVTNGQTYFYVVRAVSSVGTGPNSTEVSATPASPSKREQDLTWLWIVLILAVILIVTMFLILRKKRRSGSQPPPKEDGDVGKMLGGPTQ